MAKPKGARAMTAAERQARHRERAQARLAAADEAVRFVLALRPGIAPPRQLTELQRKLETTR